MQGKGGEEPVGRLERWTSKFRWSAHNTYLTLLCVVGMGMGMGVGWGWVGWGRVGQEGAVEGQLTQQHARSCPCYAHVKVICLFFTLVYVYAGFGRFSEWVPP